MTIANNNLLSIAAVSSGVALENNMENQAEMVSPSSEIAAQINPDGDFGFMLSLQLTEAATSKELQVTENKEVSGLFQGEEADSEEYGLIFQFTGLMDVEALTDQDIIPIESQPDVELIPGVEEISVPVTPGSAAEESAILMAAAVADDFTKDKLSQYGDKLPLSRQTDAAMLTQPVAEQVKPINLVLNDEAIKSADQENPEFNLDKQLFSDQGDSVEHVKMEKKELDKLWVKQHNAEQSGVAFKDSIPGTQAPHSQPIMGLPQSQLATPLIPSAMTLQLSPQSSTAQWGEALGEKVSVLLNNKMNLAEIRLDPPHLGKLDIQVQLKDDSATILINTQHAQTRDLIDSASFRLREFLQEAGYSSVDVNVSHHDQSMAQDDFNQQQNDAQKDYANANSVSDQGEISEAHLNQHFVTVDDGRIDYFV